MCAHKTPHSQGLFSTNQGTKSYNFTWKSSVFSLSSSLRNTPTVCTKVGQPQTQKLRLFRFWAVWSQPPPCLDNRAKSPIIIKKTPHVWPYLGFRKLVLGIVCSCFETMFCHFSLTLVGVGCTQRQHFQTHVFDLKKKETTTNLTSTDDAEFEDVPVVKNNVVKGKTWVCAVLCNSYATFLSWKKPCCCSRVTFTLT